MPHYVMFAAVLCLLLLFVFRSQSEKRTTVRKYHAAVHPELASPELVDGSKGRLQAVWLVYRVSPVIKKSNISYLLPCLPLRLTRVVH